MITLDFESRSTADLIRWGQRRYALDASTQVLCMCWAYDDEETVHLWHRNHPWIAKSKRPDELIARIRDGEPVEAHNAGFEFNVWNETLRREFPEFDVEITPEQLHCSAAKASCVSLPRALGDAAHAVNLGERKLADGRRLINKLSKPMPRRVKIIQPGDKWKKVVRAGMYARFEMGGVITNDEMYELAEGVAEAHNEPPEAVYEAVRNIFVRETSGTKTNRPTVQRLSDGVYEWIAEPRPLKLTGIIEISEKGPVEFCEEEVEHRKNWDYCKQDVRTERSLSNFCPEMSERERAFWLMDFRMNLRGVMLDREAVTVAKRLATEEAERLNGRLSDLTGGKVRKGSQRIPLLAWVNGKLTELGLDPLENTKADTLSFALDGVPTKAGDEAKEAARERMREKWEPLGQEGQYVADVLRICMEVNRSSVAKYRRMEQCVCAEDDPTIIGGDDRIHDIMLYNGADRTGRWSGKGIQPHNFVRGYSKMMPQAWEDIVNRDTDFITMVWEEPMVALAKACRGALIATPGKEMYAADFNAIEARKLAWMSNCSTLLTLFNTPGGDPYIDMAEAIYNRKLNKKDNPNERQLGKKAILGLGYAMGWEKFQATVWAEEGIWLEDEFCQFIVSVYRKKKYPEVPALWKATEKAAIAAVVEGGTHWAGGNDFGDGAVAYFMSEDRNFLHCRLPSGRLLAYLYPQVHNRVTYRFAALNERGGNTTVSFPAKKNVPQHRVRWHAEKLAAKQRKRLLGDAPESFVSPHLSFMGRDTYTKQWKRCGTHGGTLVENYDQASSRDLLAEAMYRVDQYEDVCGDKPFDLLLSIHDEVVAEAKIGTMQLKEFESLVAEVPSWAPGMPVTAEGWIGMRLRK